MGTKKFETAYRSLSYVFWPFLIALILIEKFTSIKTIILIGIVSIYAVLSYFIGILSLSIEKDRKVIIITNSIISIIGFLSFVVIGDLFQSDSQGFLLLFCLWVIVQGTVGLFTNTVLVTRGLPIEYSDEEVFWKFVNLTIIALGVLALLYLLYFYPY